MSRNPNKTSSSYKNLRPQTNRQLQPEVEGSCDLYPTMFDTYYSERLFGDDQASHSSLHVCHAVTRGADDTGTKSRVSHAQGSAKHPLARVTNARGARFGLRNEYGGVDGGGVFDIDKRRGDQGVERRV